MARPAVERFWEKVNKDGPIHPTLGTPCWLWTAGTTPHGYGQFYPRHGEMVIAHRYSWELVNGPFPDDKQGLHRCDNPPCVNPEHVWPGTQTDNMRDCVEKGRIRPHNKGATHCKRGHEFTPENTYVWSGRPDERQCKRCKHIEYTGNQGVGRMRRVEDALWQPQIR